MPKKIQLKTSKNEASPTEFIKAIEDEKLKKACQTLLEVFEQATGMPPKMWGGSIIGFGEYTYHRANGDEGQFMACGFSPRKSGPTLYILPGYENYKLFLEKLGNPKVGKSCIYLKSLDGIDLKVVAQLIKAGLKDLKKSHQTNY